MLLLPLLLAFPSLTLCRVLHLTSSPPTLSSPPDTMFLPPPTLTSPLDTPSIPPPQPLLPPFPAVSMTSTCPPPPLIPYCCVLAALPPPGSSPSMLHSLFMSIFGRICTGVIISGAICVVHQAFCRRRRAPVPHPSQGPIDLPTSHPHPASGSEVETPGQPPLHTTFEISIDPGREDFIPNVGLF